MHAFIPSALGVFLVFVIYSFTSSFLTHRRHVRLAAKMGCKPAPVRQHKYPLGLDLVYRTIKADREQVVPDEFNTIYKELGYTTFEQNILGDLNLVTVDPKNIQALLATQFNDFSLGDVRRNNFFPLLGNGIFTSDGKSWEHSRAMLRPQFAREQISDLELEEVHVQNLMKHLPTTMDDWTSPVDLAPLFFRLTLDSATEFLFGESVESQIAALPESKKSTPTDGKLDWTNFAECFDGATMALGVRGRLSEKYYLYSPSSFHNSCKRVHEFADYYVNLALEPNSSLTEKAHPSGKPRYVFLRELATQTRNPVELRSQLLNILLAGRDTTAGLLGWTFYLLARHPAHYASLRESLLTSFGTHTHPHSLTFANLKACQPLQHTLSEVLRLYPNVPVNSRRAVVDTSLPRGGGPDRLSPIFVRKGSEVNYVVHIMHRRKDLWGEDADEFKPQRWQGRKPGWEFLPFNGGPRICLGQQFALTEAGYVMTRLMQRFDKVENLDPERIVRHQYSLTTAPAKCLLRLRATKE